MASMQKAVFVTEIGKPVELGERAVPTPKADEILIQVTATMLLPHDTLGRDTGILIGEKLPAILGNNLAGIVRSAGKEAASRFQPGDRVFGISALYLDHSDQSGLQQYAVLKANAVGKIPEGFTDEQVVTLPINLVTSFTVLFTKHGFNLAAPFSPTETPARKVSIVIIGAGTNVGRFAIRLAHLAGIDTIAIAGQAGHDALKQIGATHVIDRALPIQQIQSQVNAAIGRSSRGATYVYDCANMQFDLARSLLATDEPTILRSLLPIYEEESLKFSTQLPQCDAAFMDSVGNESLAPYIEKFWATVPEWLTQGKIEPTSYRVVEGLDNLQGINDALDDYKDNARSRPQTVVKI